MLTIELVGEDIYDLVDLLLDGSQSSSYGPWESLTEDDLEFQMFDEHGLPTGGYESFLAEIVMELTDRTDFAKSAREIANALLDGGRDEDTTITRIVVSEAWHIDHHLGLTALVDAVRDRQLALGLPEVELWVLRPATGKLELC